MEKNLLFALDIGTRSVVGLVGEQREAEISLLATERQEHHTRSMLDGQIHDVPEVANVLASVKNRLEETVGRLEKVSVAAAGRALCTITTEAELEVNGKGLLTPEDERTLELSAIQAAQHQLATSDAVDDPTRYYCVGYSVVQFKLDNTAFKTLVGQRGRLASVKVIATFLPRQVIDSMQAALQKVGLEMSTLTLEPIAAINILIPPTMRHLNLALVDVGAGTSDVAITRDGLVVGYGMVPCAGDEITEAISRQYLLDFNIAENVKRQLSSAKQKKIVLHDILGGTQKIAAGDITVSIAASVAELAQNIAAQILTLNGGAPQAVLLVGGGSLTPLLPEALAEALDIPASRVAIRCPDKVDGLENIPSSLTTPDSVTPLGILKLAGSKTLNFVNVTVNNQLLHLFNLGRLTIANALLAAGINIRSLQGRPGLGITVTVNGKTKFLPGTHGKPGSILLNNNPASVADIIHENDVITVTKGIDGTSPLLTVKEVLEVPPPLIITINNKTCEIAPVIMVNGSTASLETVLKDRDEISCRLPNTLKEILTLAKADAKPYRYSYEINGAERTYTVWPTITVNGKPCENETIITANCLIKIEPGKAPTLGDITGIRDDASAVINVLFNGASISVPTRRYTFSVNGAPAQLTDIPKSGSKIEFTCFEQPNPMVTDVLLTAKFNPCSLPPGTSVDIMLNGQSVEYTAPIKNGDAVDLVISS